MSLAALLKVTSSWNDEEERDALAQNAAPRSAAAPAGALATLLEATGAQYLDPDDDDELRQIGEQQRADGRAKWGARNLKGLVGQGALDAGAGGTAEGAVRTTDALHREAQTRAALGEEYQRLGGSLGELLRAEAQAPNEQRQQQIAQIRGRMAEMEKAAQPQIQEIHAAEGLRPAASKVQEFRQAVRDVYPVDADVQRSIPGQVVTGVSQAIAGLPAYLTGLGIPASAAQMFDQGFSDAKAKGADDETALQAGVANMPAALLEQLGDKLQIGGLVRALRQGKPGAISIAREAVKGLIGEAGTEGAQQVFQNATARASYDPERPLLQDAGEASLVGGLTGATVAGSTAAAGEGITRLQRDDTRANVPESRETLAAQQQQLIEGLRPAQMFPLGTEELSLPDGMERIQTPRGVFHFNPTAITADEIRAASQEGRENDVLALGPNSKADVDARARETGEPVLTLTERDAAGREVKSAVTTPSLAPETAAELESTKTPGNTVRPEPVARVVADRTRTAQPSGTLARILRETDDGADSTPPPRPRSTAPALTDAEAAVELDAIRKAFPELTREYDMEIGLVEESLRKRGYRGPVPEQVQAAVLRTNAQRSLIVLGAHSYRDRQKGAALLTHEIAHPFWDTLPQKTKAQLRAMHVLEVENKTGPLYQDGRLRSELDFVENMDENGAREWFAERIARLNEDWAKGRIDRAELSLLRQLAAELRERVQRIWATMARREGISAEDQLFVDQFRRFFLAGADANVGRRAGEAFAQKLAAPRVPVNPPAAAAAAFATSKNGDAGAKPATKAELLAALKRARAMRDEAIRTGDTEKETDGIMATAAARNELDERFPGWDKAEKRQPIDAAKNPTAAAAHLRSARQRLADRPDSAFRSDISEPVAQDLDILADLRDYAELTRRESEDFVAFGDRMRADLGDRITAYLPDAWDAVSGGRPLRDLYVSDNPLKVDEAWKRAATYGRLFWEGAADVLRRNKFTALADAVDRHVDLGDRNFANAWAIVGPAISKFQGVTGLARRSRAKRVLREWSAYFAARESGNPAETKRILETAHDDTKALIEATRRLFEFTGYHNERLGVMVYDPKIQGIRRGGNLGADYFPRMLRDEINAVLRDPSTNPALWEEMKAQLQENGNIQHTDDAGQFLKNNIPRETTDDFFSNLEMARSSRLPDSWYETDFLKVIPRFVTSWAERSAQIEAFGQKIGDEGKDAFDRAIESTRNEAAQRYIEATREHAYRVSRLDPSTRKIIGNITSATSALFLGNPYSTLRNLIGGTAQAVNQFGGLKALRALREARAAITDAQAAGALKADVADLLFQGDASGPVREFTNVALKLGGFNAAEQVVRATNFLMARTFLRDSFAHFRRDAGSRASLQAAALMQRYGFDPQSLLAENLKGPETDRFIRAAVREAQGGYRYNQVPLFLNSPAGRFVAQFARWGTMAARFHVRNVIAPAIVGERVRVRVGDQVTEKRVRTLLPLLRSPFVAMAAGALTYAAREALFGFDRVDPTWDEILKTYDEDDQRGIDLALSRMAADVIMGGSFGAITDYAGMLKEAATRGRYRNPIEPPAASILKELGVLAYKRAQQGRLTGDDYHQFASRVLTAYRYGRAAFYNFGEMFGLDTTEARLFRADLDKRFTRAAGNRFAEELGFDIPAFNAGGLPSVNENTPFYSSMEDALLSGDTYEAAQLLRRELAPLGGKKRSTRLTAIKTSILGRQPLKAGGRSAEEMQREFIGWARRRLSPGEQQRMFEIQRRYLDTALRAGLLTPEEHARRTQYLPRVSSL